MELRVTTYSQGIVMIYSPDPLHLDGPVSCEHGSGKYYNTVGRRLTRVAACAVDHLCRGLDGVKVGLLADDHRISLSPQGDAADTLFNRICARVGPSPTSIEADLRSALVRDLGLTDLSLTIAGSATPEAVPLPT